jgi:hypothetical protein
VIRSHLKELRFEETYVSDFSPLSGLEALDRISYFPPTLPDMEAGVTEAQRN